MDFDESGIFYSDQQRPGAEQDESQSPTAARIKYREFVRTFRDGETFVYRDALRQAVSLNQPVLEVDLDHVMAWDDGACAPPPARLWRAGDVVAPLCTACSRPLRSHGSLGG